MVDKPNNKFNPMLAIGFIVAFLFLSIGIFTLIADTGISLSERYQLGMLKIVMSVLGMIGGIILSIVASVKNRKRYICSLCGTKAQTHDDKFCRVCGTSLPK
ncbi:MAG: hypothetical protein IPP66_08830 [Anaerolineales bacterium]|nr:hypothetical protein [Anaerolineales bacterium]